MKTSDFVLSDVRDKVLTLTLNRPEVFNAWHGPMRAMLNEKLKSADQDPNIRAIIMTGAGDRAFCAGQDLKEVQDFKGADAPGWQNEWRVLYGEIRNLSKPLVMALNGIAAGSGFQVALLGDIRVGHPGVRMGQTEMDVGLPSIVGPWIMREMLGHSRMVELTLRARLMDGEECFNVGIIHQLVPKDMVLSEARSIALELAAKPPHAIRLTKRWFKEMTEEALENAIQAAARISTEAYDTGEPAAMMKKFYETRAAARPRKDEKKAAV